MFHDHMLKAKRLTDFRLPYVVLVSKFIEYFAINVEDELEESTGLLNHTSNQNLHKMGFLKVGNGWTAVGAVVGGAHDHEVGPSGAHHNFCNERFNALDAKSMTSMICSTHSIPEMILRMIECGGYLGSCITSLCF